MAHSKKRRSVRAVSPFLARKRPEPPRSARRGHGGTSPSPTLKSDDLCEQLAIFWPGSCQSHQEAPGEARRSLAFAHSKKRRSVRAVSHFLARKRPKPPRSARRGQDRQRQARRGQEKPGGARRGQERPRGARRGQEKPREAKTAKTRGKPRLEKNMDLRSV